LGAPHPFWVPAATGAVIGATFALLNRYCKARVWVQPQTAINVVVTGGSKGLGKAIARELATSGDRVLITSRTQQGVDEAVQQLRQEAGPGAQVYGAVCDVADPESIAALEQVVEQTFGSSGVHAWVNNAGYSGSFRNFLDSEASSLHQVVTTNLLGTVLCSRLAMRLFQRQEQEGHIFNVDGAGSDGFATPQYAAYGSTKAGIAQLGRSLAAELKGSKIKVHTVSPGMILTDLLLEGTSPAVRQAFNILCEHPETVAAFLVPRMKTAVARGQHGRYIRFLTPSSALWRFVTAPMRLNRFFDGEGKPTYPDEKERIMGRHAKATARRAAAARRRNTSLQLAYSLSVMAVVVALLAESTGTLHG